MKQIILAAALAAITAAAHAQCGPVPYGISEQQYCAQNQEMNLRAMMREEIARERWRATHQAPPYRVRRQATGE
jgi:hypothetical protein